MKSELALEEKNLATDQAYEARGIVGKLEPIGFYMQGPINVPFYRFLTLYQGEGKSAIPVEFYGQAPFERDEVGGKYLNIAAVKEGMFVVNPGLLYRKCLWFDALMAVHMRAVASYRPKVVTVAERSSAPAVVLPTIDATSDHVTQQ